MAVREMLHIGVPASITLAQALLESDAGRSELAQHANNHFGIKCGANWDGFVYYKKDDDIDVQGNLTYSCFRAYPDVEASYRDHSNYLSAPENADRYGSLFNLGHIDYRSWAFGLKEAGYATGESYPQKLINLIERFDLHQYDLVTPVPEPDLEKAILFIPECLLHRW